MKLATAPAEQRVWMEQWRQTVCQTQAWQFCFIGGIAVQRWGEPRLTDDVDVKLGRSSVLSKRRP